MNLQKLTASPEFKRASKEKKLVAYLLAVSESDRFEIGRAIGDGYVPNVVHELRHVYGFDLPWRRLDYVDADGKPTWKALYFLSDEDKERATDFAGELLE